MMRKLLRATEPASRLLLAAGAGRSSWTYAAWRMVAGVFVGREADMNINGLTLRAVAGDGLGFHLVMRGVWEPLESGLFLQRLQPGMRVADVGAHVGYYTLLAASAVGEQGRVYAFEAEPRNYALLAGNIQRNHLTYVTAMQSLVGATTGTGELYVHPSQSGMHSINRRSADSTAITCSRAPLDELIPDGRVDFLKIDAEGSEIEALGRRTAHPCGQSWSGVALRIRTGATATVWEGAGGATPTSRRLRLCNLLGRPAQAGLCARRRWEPARERS